MSRTLNTCLESCYTILLLVTMSGCREYCQWETFTAQCDDKAVIVMNSAQYGRMEYGRCIERDYGYVGCSTNALYLADHRCSGRRHCEIEIPDKMFDKVTPCPKDLVRYMTAEYQCIKVESPSRRDCYGSKFMRVTKPSGHIASITTNDTNCGSTETPWLIEAKPGQTINFTLHDFALQSVDNGSVIKSAAESPHCLVYAIFKESHTRRSSSICGGKARVTPRIYSSTSHEVQIRILGGKAANTRHFLLEWQVLGCPNLEPVSGGWVKYNGDVATVGCSDSSDTWRVVCNQSEWHGQLGSCSAAASQKVLMVGFKFPQALSIIIIIAVALGIGALILMIGLVCLKRRRNAARVPERKYSSSGGTGGLRVDNYFTTSTGYCTGYSQPSLLTNNDMSGWAENEYEYVEDVLNAPPPPSGGKFHTTLSLPPSTNICDIHDFQSSPYGFNGAGSVGTWRNADRNRANPYDPTSGPQYYELDPSDEITKSQGCDAAMPIERHIAKDIGLLGSRQKTPRSNSNFGHYSQ